MKKLLLLGLVISSMGIIGCTNQKEGTSSFKEYTFDKTLNDVERMELVSNVKQQLGGLTSYSMNTLIKTNREYNKSESKIKNNLTFYDKHHIHAETDSELSQTSNGITTKQKIKSVYDRFDEDLKVITYSVVDDKLQSYSVVDKNDALTYSDIICDYIVANLGNYRSMTAYQDGKGYAFVTSTISERREAVLWGDKTKEYYSRTRNQLVFKVNSSYQITSFYSFNDTETNRDTETGKWYDKAKQVSLSTRNATLKYENMKQGSSVRSVILDAFKNGYFYSIAVTSSPERITLSTTRTNTSPSRSHVVASCDIGNYSYYYGSSQIALSFVANVYKCASLSSDYQNEQCAIEPAVASGSNLEMIGSTVYIPLTSTALTLTIEFDIELVGGDVSISNATISLK